MWLLRKLKNVVNPYKIDTCSTCDHVKYLHHPDRITYGYPGITCYGQHPNPFSSDAFRYANRCRCESFIKKTNLDYLEYKDREVNG